MLTALEHLGEATLVVDEDNSTCPDWHHRSPKRIDCYQVTERGDSGAAFKLDPARLVYSLRLLHKGSRRISSLC
jgi:hypothetical protein